MCTLVILRTVTFCSVNIVVLRSTLGLNAQLIHCIKTSQGGRSTVHRITSLFLGKNHSLAVPQTARSQVSSL